MNEVAVIINKEVLKSPEAIAEMIKVVADDIKECKSDLKDIKNRTWYRKIFKSSSNDIIDAVVKQNDTVSLLFNIIQGVLLLNLHNAKLIGGVCKHLQLLQSDVQAGENELLDMSMDFLTQFVNSSQKSEKELEDIKNQLIEKSKVDEKQDRAIQKLTLDNIEKEKLDAEQSRKINDLANALINKDELDSEQTERISRIIDILQKKDGLDQKQNDEIKMLTEIAQNNKLLLNGLDKQTNHQFLNLSAANLINKKRIINLNIILAVNVAVNIGILIYIALYAFNP